MAKNYIRRSVWENCGVLLDDEAFISNPEKGNKELYWYAKAVAEMRKLPLEDHNSWGFFGAMHDKRNAVRADSSPALVMWGLGVASGSILAGQYWEKLSGEYIFILAGFSALLGLLLINFLPKTLQTIQR